MVDALYSFLVYNMNIIPMQLDLNDKDEKNKNNVKKYF